MSGKVKKEITMIHESFFASLANDTATFGGLIFLFWVNQEYLSSAIPSVVLIIMFILYTFSKFSYAKKRIFTTKAQAQAFIDEFYGKEK